MSANKSVGLFIVTKLPNDDLVALLQARGRWNFETDKLETYPGCCQATASGGVGENESYEEAARREAYEELGPTFSVLVLEAFKRGDVYTLPIVKEGVQNYALLVEYVATKKIALHPSSGGLRSIRLGWTMTIDERVSPVVKDEHRVAGPAGSTRIIMFSDAIASLKDTEQIYIKQR